MIKKNSLVGSFLKSSLLLMALTVSLFLNIVGSVPPSIYGQSQYFRACNFFAISDNNFYRPS